MNSPACDDEPLLEFSPFANSKSMNKREASDDISPDSKRSSQDMDLAASITPMASIMPSMDRAVSAKAVQSLVPPKNPKKQSQYVRFKSIMLKDVKAKGDKEAVKDITNRGTNAWSWVKDRAIPESISNPTEEPKEPVPASAPVPAPEVATPTTELKLKLELFLGFKHQAIQEEIDEAAKHDAGMEAFRGNFCDAAISFLYWEEEEANDRNVKAFEKGLKMVHSKAVIAWGSALPEKYLFSYKKSSAKLHLIQKRMAVNELTHNLKNANEDKLREHAIAHFDVLKKLERMEAMEKEIASFQQAKDIAKNKEELSAYSMKSEICKDLNKQMIYTNSSLKQCWKAISFKKSGVTKLMFAKAFDVKEGIVKTTFDGDDVGYKSLRYSSLQCSEVSVKLVGDTLTANTKYGFRR
jgi:hypothetical protein